MVTDRPDFTESAATVTPGRVQVEAGYTLTGTDATTRQDVGEVLVRLGIGAASELRFGLGSYAVADPREGPTAAGLVGTSAGFKHRLPSTGIVPEAAVIIATTIPTSSELSEGSWAPSAVLAGAWTAGPVGLGANLGYAHVETADGRGEVLGSVAGGLPVGRRLGAFLEVYGHLRRASSLRATVDAGLTLTVTPDFQLDLRVGRSVRGPTQSFVGVGLALRR